MKLKIPLYDFQREGVEFAVSRKYSLNGDRMGLGKTAQALSLACEVNSSRTLIICPAFLVPNWKAEIDKFIGAEYVNRFTVISYDSIFKLEDFSPFDLVVCDEVHYLKSLHAKRTQAVHTRVVKHPPKYFLGLSGTPIKNRVPEFYSLLKLCWEGGKYPEFNRYSASPWLFNRDFTHQTILRFGSRKVTKFEGVKDPIKLRDLIKPIYIRRKTEDVLSLPDQVRQEILISEKSKTDELLKIAWDSYGGKKESESFSSGKAISALAKVEFTIELAKEIINEGNSVVVFTDHVQAAKKLAEGLGPRVKQIDGSVSADTRNEFVDLLNMGRINVLVSTIASLSVGVNLTGCNYMVFNDFPWVPADMDQAEARIHRIGQTKKCFYYYVLASKVDQIIYRTLRMKRKLIAEVGT